MVMIITIYFLLILFPWDYLPINSISTLADINNSWTYTSIPPYAFEA